MRWVYIVRFRVASMPQSYMSSSNQSATLLLICSSGSTHTLTLKSYLTSKLWHQVRLNSILSKWNAKIPQKIVVRVYYILYMHIYIAVQYSREKSLFRWCICLQNKRTHAMHVADEECAERAKRQQQQQIQTNGCSSLFCCCHVDNSAKMNFNILLYYIWTNTIIIHIP